MAGPEYMQKLRREQARRRAQAAPIAAAVRRIKREGGDQLLANVITSNDELCRRLESAMSIIAMRRES